MFARKHLSLGLVLLAAAAAFVPVLSNGFVNWDDPSTIVDNARLVAADVVRWAFTTDEMGHYQPLSWLAWAVTRGLFGLNATAFHALSLAGHLLNVALVYVLALRLTAIGGVTEPRRRVTATVGAFLFGVHPLQVEVVAWASAYPYVLSLNFLLLSLIAYVNQAGERSQRGMFALSAASYGVSQLVRASAVAFPVVLLLIDVYPLRRSLTRRVLLEKLPFVVIAVGIAAAESMARELATLQEVGVGARLTMAATAPFIYLWRTVMPLRLTPLDPLPIEPRVAWIPLLLGVAGLIALTIAAWRVRRSRPALAVAWATYILLLAPAVGLTPSGQQATADRYMYLPGVVVSLLIGVAVASALSSQPVRRVVLTVGCLTVAVLLMRTTAQQVRWWRDSVTLWSRVAELDARNDIATYNLAIALARAGRDEEAMKRYEQTLALVPDHDLARANLDRMRAKRMDKDVSDTNARAFALVQAGRHREAADMLTQALGRHPENHELAHNLARLLATTPDPSVRNGAVALRLALAVRDRMGGNDPRVLDTVAAAYAAQEQFDRAHETSLAAARAAAAAGDQEMARLIENQARRYLELHGFRNAHPASRDRH
jgi:tetratricopeptide (TPR) repeat protein